MAQVTHSPKVYDVCIIGSGAAGGTAAKVLTEGGSSVVMLEAGPPIHPETDYKEHVWPYELEHRGAGVGGTLRHALNDEFMAPNGAWTIEGEPYTSAPGSNFQWFRSRVVGGRTNHWGRIALRFAPVDFRARSTDGYGDDWPISYEEIAPYYDKVEEFIGISGAYENLPQLPDSKFLPAMAYTCGELALKKAVDKMGDPHRRVTIGRCAILTKPLHQGTPDARAACHWCGHCDRGCTTGSYYSSPASTLPAAARTGNMTLVTNAVVSHIVVDASTGK